MATKFKVTVGDVTTEYTVKPKHILKSERLGKSEAPVESTYHLAWYASGSEVPFEEWLDGVDDIEPILPDDEAEGDIPPYHRRIAALAAHTGIAPRALALEDEEMLVALEWAVRGREERWTTERELAATGIELTHALLLTTLRVNGAKNVGKTLHVPRPWDELEKPKAIRMGEFARRLMGVAHG